MEFQFAAATDVGLVRPHNEDQFLVDKRLRCFIVADGMGGHASGEIASAMAVHHIRDTLATHAEMFAAFRAGAAEPAPAHVLAALEQAIQGACAAIFAESQANPAHRGMGTTVSVLLLAGDENQLRGFIGHVGDSRVYLTRQGQAHVLTDDHSLMNELIRRGKLSRGQIDQSPYRSQKNAVTRAVGVYATVEVDTFDFDVLPGDQFLICSDGLHTYLEEDDLPKHLTGASLEAVPRGLIEHANKSGGHDNITAVVVRISNSDSDLSEDIQRRLVVLRHLPLFRFLSYKELVQLAAITEAATFASGDTLFAEGSVADRLVVVLSGRIELTQVGHPARTIAAKEMFGELALVEATQHSHTAVATEPTRVITLARPAFLALLKREPSTSVKLLWSLVQLLGRRLRLVGGDADVLGPRDIPGG